MPDFLEKLHTAALRAKNLEVGIHDYAGVIKSSDTNRQPSQERLSGENTHTGGPGQIYAWDGYLIDQGLCWHEPQPNPPANVFGTLCELQMEVATFFKDKHTVCSSIYTVIMVVVEI